jgi:hypothetical protein
MRLTDDNGEGIRDSGIYEDTDVEGVRRRWAGGESRLHHPCFSARGLSIVLTQYGTAVVQYRPCLYLFTYSFFEPTVFTDYGTVIHPAIQMSNCSVCSQLFNIQPIQLSGGLTTQLSDDSWMVERGCGRSTSWTKASPKEAQPPVFFI